jgi:hypothetical protein
VIMFIIATDIIIINYDFKSHIACNYIHVLDKLKLNTLHQTALL